MSVPQQQTSRCGGKEVKCGRKRAHAPPFVCGQTRFDDTHRHYVRSAAVCEDTDRLVNMVEPPFDPGPVPRVNSINVAPDNLFHIYWDCFISPRAVIGLLM